MISEEFKALRETCSDDSLVELRKRNEERVKQVIERMGEKHLLHPSKKVQYVPYRSVLCNK